MWLVLQASLAELVNVQRVEAIEAEIRLRAVKGIEGGPAISPLRSTSIANELSLRTRKVKA